MKITKEDTEYTETEQGDVWPRRVTKRFLGLQLSGTGAYRRVEVSLVSIKTIFVTFRGEIQEGSMLGFGFWTL